MNLYQNSISHIKGYLLNNLVHVYKFFAESFCLVIDLYRRLLRLLSEVHYHGNML